MSKIAKIQFYKISKTNVFHLWRWPWDWRVWDYDLVGPSFPMLYRTGSRCVPLQDLKIMTIPKFMILTLRLMCIHVMSLSCMQ